MRLPVEVCEVVIDQASDNPQSLHHLSLTCIAFVPRARYHLFTSIIIRTMEQMDTCLGFLNAHPWISPRVRKVSFSASIPQDNHLPNVHLLEVVPVHVLNRLPNLRGWSMEVQFSGHLPQKTPFLSLHRSVLRSYRKYVGGIHDLHLNHITFNDIFDFTGLVSSFTTIRSLSCAHISVRTKREPDPSLYKPGTLRLSTLEVRFLHSRRASWCVK